MTLARKKNMLLTEQQVAELTGRTRRSAQVRVLRYMAIEHKIRPDGSVAVLRAHVDKLLGGQIFDVVKKPSEPDWSAV